LERIGFWQPVPPEKLSSAGAAASLMSKGAMAKEARVQHDSPTKDALRMLESCVVFRALDGGARRRLADHAKRRQFAAGQTIFASGSPGHSMMAVVTGSVRITARSVRGTEVMLAVLTQGEVVGEIALLDGGERTADATALTNCELVVLDRRDVLPFLEQHPKACLKLLEVLAQRLRHTDEWITEIALAQIAARLAKVLLGTTDPQGRRSDKNRVLSIALTQRELGSMIGASRESVNRCLQQWQRGGIVQLKPGQIIILNRDAMQEIAELG
jgi:CRP/FNR family cyclic AMP-dependent transcriptional regulator